MNPVAKELHDRIAQLEATYEHELGDLWDRLAAFQNGCEHIIRPTSSGIDCDECGYPLQDRLGRARAIQRGRA